MLVGVVKVSLKRGLPAKYLKNKKARFRYTVVKTTIRRMNGTYAYKPTPRTFSIARKCLMRCGFDRKPSVVRAERL